VGIIEDEKVRDDLIPLCRFFSSRSDQNLTSLPEYVARMPEDQKQIFYVVGETRAAASMSPAMEKLKEKGWEVLYVSEPIDEMTLQNIETYQGKTVLDAGKEAAPADMSDDEKAVKEQTNLGASFPSSPHLPRPSHT
jgi:HSP90 family molecular chaperone